METLTLLKANIKHKKGSFISISLLMLIITLSISSILSTTKNIDKNLNKAIEGIDSGDILIFLDEKFCDETFMEKLLDDSNVEKVKDQFVLMPKDLKVNGQAVVVTTFLVNATDNQGYQVYNKKQNGFLDKPEALKKGEVYVPLAYQSLFDCKIGKKLSFSTEKGTEEFTIKGFIQEPFFGAYVIDTKLLLLSEEDFKRISKEYDAAADKLHYPLWRQCEVQIYQKENSNLDIAELKRVLNESSNIINYSTGSLSKEDSIEYTTMFTDVFGGMLTTFVVLLVIIMLIVMGHSISTGVEMDYTNLGILKSVGFTKEEIRRILGMQYVIAEVIGAFLGVLASFPCIKLLGMVFQPITGIIASSEPDIWRCLAIIMGILVICIIYVYLKTAKVSQISPIKAIGGGHADIYFDSRLRIKLKQKGLTFWMALRQLTTGVKQYLGLVIIAGILVYFMMATTTLATCMTPDSLRENFGATISDITLKLDENFPEEKVEEIDKAVEQMAKVEQSFYYTAGYYSVEGYEYLGKAFSKPEEFRSIIDGRAPLYENEIVVSQTMSDELNKKIGDRVTINHSDKSEEYIISGYYQSTSDAGRSFGFSLEASYLIDGDKPSRGYYKLEDSEQANKVVQELNQKYNDILEAELTQEDGSLIDLIQTALDVVSVIIYLVSSVFALIVIYMVCGKTFLKERHDIGIYKAMGVTCMNLRLQFAIRFAIIALIGSGLGTIVYACINDKMMSSLFSTFGIYNFTTEYHVAMLLIPILFICVCFFVFSMLSSGKVKTVSAKELIVE